MRSVTLAGMLLLVLLTQVSPARAQLPDCISGTVMYSVFSNTSTVTDSTEIRPVNYSTGAIGSLMGNRR